MKGRRLWLPPRGSCIPYLTQGWGLHMGLCPMTHLEVVKSKPVQVPVEQSVKLRIDLGHHEIKLPGRARGEGSEFGRCVVGGSVRRA